ncbi:MAG: putative molybdenum carrier protein [Rhodothermales bacterium]
MTRKPLVIHSGGQTGVDRAALDAALAAGVPVGGWCPLGRWAEDGPIPSRYPLRETPTPEVAERTRWNVRDADATLILTRGTPTGGTATTLEAVDALGKPRFVVDLAQMADVAPVAAWVRANGATVLNVAGPRESTAPGIYAEAHRFMTRLLRALGGR